MERDGELGGCGFRGHCVEESPILYGTSGPMSCKEAAAIQEGAVLLSVLQPLPLYLGPTEDGLFLGQGRSGEGTSKAPFWREKGEGCLMLVSRTTQ